MFLLSLLSLTLFTVPIFLTFGAFFAAEHEKILDCGFHCNTEGGGGLSGTPFPGAPGGGSGGDDVAGEIFCQLSYGIESGDYLFNPNQWGNPNGKDGALCIKFESNSDQDGYAAQWSTTWEFLTQGPEDAPVHAFPNAQLSDDSLPVQLGAMSGLELDISWSYAMGSQINKGAIDDAALNQALLNTNVAVDMFLAGNQDDSQSTTKSDYEVLVWLGRYGTDSLPLGFAPTSMDTRTVAGTTFDLYSEVNGFGQTTFTWVAGSNMTDFNGDVGPLINNLEQYGGPKPNDYLGYVAFGTETFHANQNATFYNSKLELKVLK